MTNTKTEFDLLIKNMTMEDLFDKNTLLQTYLSNLPQEVVNIIDTLSNEVIPPHFTELLKDSSVDKLCDILSLFSKKITNMKNSRIPLEKRKTTIISFITDEINKLDEPTTLVDKIIKDHFTKKTKNIEWLNEFVVGEEVLVNYKKGKIEKINPKSVSVSMYTFDIINDDFAWNNQTFGTIRYIWKPEIRDTIVIHSREKLIKRGEDEGAFDRYFIEGERSVDYGN